MTIVIEFNTDFLICFPVMESKLISHNTIKFIILLLPCRTGTKKDVGVILLLIPNTGLGVPSREISNAASPRQG